MRAIVSCAMLVLLSYLLISSSCGSLNSPHVSPCNIHKIYLRDDDVIDKLPDIPTIYVGNVDRNARVAGLVSKIALTNNYGDVPVVLSTSNTYSYDKVTMSLEDYIHYMETASYDAPANETYYLFGDNFNQVWADLEHVYELPPYKYCKRAGAVTFGIGGKYSGVSFHFHGPGFSEVLLGSKKFLLFPYMDLGSTTDVFQPDMTQYEWMQSKYTQLVNSEFPLQECELFPGDMLYFPNKWYHATLNMQEFNVFVSVFLDTQLMKD